jgi:hypothetical protein
MIDMIFVHRLEAAISSVLSKEQTRTLFPEPLAEQINVDIISKKIAQELYFRLDPPTLMDLAMYKYREHSS